MIFANRLSYISKIREMSSESTPATGSSGTGPGPWSGEFKFPETTDWMKMAAERLRKEPKLQPMFPGLKGISDLAQLLKKDELNELCKTLPKKEEPPTEYYEPDMTEEMKVYCYGVTNPPPGTRPVTPEETFKELLSLREQNRLPALVFDESEPVLCTQFGLLVDWLEKEDAREFSVWHEMNRQYADIVKEFNKELAEVEEQYIKSKKQAHLDKARSMRLALSKKIKLQPVNSGIAAPYMKAEIAKIQRACNPQDSEEFVPFPIPCKGAGPYYVFSDVSEFSRFKSMLVEPEDREDEKIQKLVQTLIDAERITRTDIEGYVDLVNRGAAFGIGIISKLYPFVIQYEMLRILKNRKLNVSFASESMAMGINYPIRSVVIRQMQMKDISVCNAMQMGGRAGRRGLDTEGNVLYWNVKNWNKIGSEHLPPMKFPKR